MVFPPDILRIEILSGLSRIKKSQEDKADRIAVRGFGSVRRRKADLHFSGLRGSSVFVNSPPLIGVKGVGQFLLVVAAAYCPGRSWCGWLAGFSCINTSI